VAVALFPVHRFWGRRVAAALRAEACRYRRSGALRQSGFAITNLNFWLKQKGITHGIVVGLLANTCIESTARFRHRRLAAERPGCPF
jgi:nicotinamidase-related amidase